MRSLTFLFTVFFSCALQAAALDESAQGVLPRGAASQYSFADLYRLTVSGPAVAAFPLVPAAADAPVRVAAAPVPAQFSVAPAPEPKLGLLLLSGIAAAVWVARRRLGYAL